MTFINSQCNTTFQLLTSDLRTTKLYLYESLNLWFWEIWTYLAKVHQNWPTAPWMAFINVSLSKNLNRFHQKQIKPCVLHIMFQLIAPFFSNYVNHVFTTSFRCIIIGLITPESAWKHTWVRLALLFIHLIVLIYIP